MPPVANENKWCSPYLNRGKRDIHGSCHSTFIFVDNFKMSLVYKQATQIHICKSSAYAYHVKAGPVTQTFPFLSSKSPCLHKGTPTMYMFLSLTVLRFSFPSSCALIWWPSFTSGLAINLPNLLFLTDALFVAECEESRPHYSPYHPSTSAWSPRAFLKGSWGHQLQLSASILS